MMNTRMIRLGLLAAVVSVSGWGGGCSALRLGPEPSNEVTTRPDGSKLLTDAELTAVTPAADEKNDAGQMWLEQRIVPETMPAATSPADKVRDLPQALMVQEAILLGLQNNNALKVQKYNVPMQRTVEEIRRADFDPSISAQLSGGRSASPNSRGETNYVDQINAQIATAAYLPTGTTISAAYTTNNAFYSDASSSSHISATVTQALLQGAGMEVNLASLRQAELSTKITQYELRGFAEALVSLIEQTYWDLAFAERQVVIVENALTVAQAQLDQTNALIELDKAAGSERAAAEAEVALRKENLINAKSTLETTRIRFLQLITPPGEPFWDKTVALRTLPAVPEGKMDPVDNHVAVAMKLRPEINQTKLQIQQGDLLVVRTKNGLLPQLDLFLTLGKTGYSNNFGGSIAAIDGP
ncbi:MAG: TolC family protein, partial [Phycisphaerales bacterium]|nr:TolC family protein [Phycisphaerales bacterium]